MDTCVIRQSSGLFCLTSVPCGPGASSTGLHLALSYKEPEPGVRSCHSIGRSKSCFPGLPAVPVQIFQAMHQYLWTRTCYAQSARDCRKEERGEKARTSNLNLTIFKEVYSLLGVRVGVCFPVATGELAWSACFQWDGERTNPVLWEAGRNTRAAYSRLIFTSIPGVQAIPGTTQML